MKIYILTLLTSIILSIILGLIFIPLLKKINGFQPILKYVKEHFNKSGTPTMGGVFFIIATLITFIIFNKGSNRLSVTALAVGVAFSIVGFIDDFIKIKFKRNEGLTPLQKILFQTSISVIVCVFSYQSGIINVYVPFINLFVNLGFFTAILNFFAFLGAVNSVNLTDGLDGLCASTSIVYLIAITVLISVEIKLNTNLYVNLSEYENLKILALSLAGALIGYLVFNVNKASVFMGDTGSLAIGGFIASISVFSSNVLYLFVIGITFVISAISVIIQVLHFKRTGKRVFLMAPFHHHFQHKGYGEAKISYLYALTTLLISLVAILCVMG